MGILEQITQLKNQGMEDKDIIANLQQQGVSPKEINDAFSQSQIKSAVSREDSGMEPSVMNNQQQNYIPQTQEISQQYQDYNPQQYSQDQDYSNQDAGYYPEYEEYGYAPGGNTDTIIEIAEQVFSEKIKKLQKQVNELNEIKTLAQTKVDHVNERLKRIESVLDKLQIAILDRVGSYGKTLESIKKEISMIENSIGKKKSPK